MYASRVLAVAMATIVYSAVGDDTHMNELKEHYEHLHYIAQFPCHHPQPRVLSVHKLFSQEHTHGKAFFPDVTVLHRCDDEAGCCTSGKQCRSTKYDAVELPFKITFLEDTPKHKKGSWIMEYHIVENHTLCACEFPPSDHECSPDVQKPELPGQHGSYHQETVGSAFEEAQPDVQVPGQHGSYQQEEAQPDVEAFQRSGADVSTTESSVDQLISDIF